MQIKMTILKIYSINKIAIFIDKINAFFIDFEFSIVENSMINVKKIAEIFSVV